MLPLLTAWRWSCRAMPLALAVWATGCADEPMSTQPECSVGFPAPPRTPPPTPPQAPPRTPPIGADNNVHTDFMDLAERIPGFGGASFENARTLVILLKDLEHEALARKVFAEIAVRGIVAGFTADVPMRVVKVKYSYAELAEPAAKIFAQPDVDFVFFDISESENKMVIGVANESQKAVLESHPVIREIPLDALVIERMEPMYAWTGRQSGYRALRGGLKNDTTL